MKLTLKGYSCLFAVQSLFMLVDLGINSFSFLARGNKTSIISIFITQDILILLSLGLLIFAAYSSCVYQRGLVDLLYSKFRTPILVLTLYFFLCISHHIWIICGHNKSPYSFQWPIALTALIIVQRLFSPIYYYLYKRSALKISDPRFYEKMEWMTEQLGIK